MSNHNYDRQGTGYDSSATGHELQGRKRGDTAYADHLIGLPAAKPSEDVLDQADTMSLSELEAEIEGSGIDPATCVDNFVLLNGDRFFVTKL